MEALVLVEHELLLFAGVFFLLGAVDELMVDLAWIGLKVTGRARTPRADGATGAPLDGPVAVFIPAWAESEVIGATVSHLLTAWPQAALRLYVGCYRNDPRTVAAATAAGGDPRLRLVIHGCDGPSTKGDCLNRLFAALRHDEERQDRPFRMIVLHDAEDMVDQAALLLLDRAIGTADLAQLPVLPIPVERGRWISGHYVEEFCEAHGKALVVRDALRAGIPSAGVGCAVARPMLDRLAELRGGEGPFAADCLTEDYELGLGVAAIGGQQRFLRYRDEAGRLIATRACFPARLDQAVRQKTRWVHGIAFQGWDRLGWSARPGDMWMRLRDRRGPLTAIVLAAAYLLLVLAAIGWAGEWAGYGVQLVPSPLVNGLLVANFASFLWRAAWRFGFTAREYGALEGARAVLRIPLANIIAIMAGRRAIAAYVGVLSGQRLRWDKTHHDVHPALLRAGKRA
jgi:adsorption protein B